MNTISLSVLYLRVDPNNCHQSHQTLIQLEPSWQRDCEVWPEKVKVRFIETIMLQRTANPLWLISNPEKKSEDVLDGLHRSSTAISFLKNGFPIRQKFLTDKNIKEKFTEIFPEKDQIYFRDLPPDIQLQIRNYQFIINVLDSSYYYDANKRLDMYYILNKSSFNLNAYEFNKMRYNTFFSMIKNHKSFFVENFVLTKKDARGVVDSEIIDLFVLAHELPNSWSSMTSLREKFYSNHFGDELESAEEFIEENRDDIEDKISFIRKIIKTLSDNHFFRTDKKLFATNYMVYKFIIARLAYNLKKISTFNRHIMALIEQFNEQILNDEVDLQNLLGCKNRNASFQRKLISKLDDIIGDNLHNNSQRRLFTKVQIQNKLKEQGGVCAICKQSKENYEGDHILEWSNGGNTTMENLQVLCKLCHYNKK